MDLGLDVSPLTPRSRLNAMRATLDMMQDVPVLLEHNENDMAIYTYCNSEKKDGSASTSFLPFFFCLPPKMSSFFRFFFLC